MACSQSVACATHVSTFIVAPILSKAFTIFLYARAKIKSNPPTHMYPPRWGPIFWRFLHVAVEINCSSDGTSVWTEELCALIVNTIKIIPCPVCRIEATKYVVSHPPASAGTTWTPVEWVSSLHNYVSQKIGNQVYSLGDSRRMVQALLNGTITRHVHNVTTFHQRPLQRKHKSTDASNKRAMQIFTVVAVSSACLGVLWLYHQTRRVQQTRKRKLKLNSASLRQPS